MKTLDVALPVSAWRSTPTCAIRPGSASTSRTAVTLDQGF